MCGELLPAQNQAYELGLELKLPPYRVEEIHSTFTDPQKCFRLIITEFTQQVEPRPTWKAIVKALKSPAVNLPALAGKVEVAHLYDSTLTHGASIGML